MGRMKEKYLNNLDEQTYQELYRWEANGYPKHYRGKKPGGARTSIHKTRVAGPPEHTKATAWTGSKNPNEIKGME